MSPPQSKSPWCAAERRRRRASAAAASCRPGLTVRADDRRARAPGAVGGQGDHGGFSTHQARPRRSHAISAGTDELTQGQPERLADPAAAHRTGPRRALAGGPKREHGARQLVAEHADRGPCFATCLGWRLVWTGAPPARRATSPLRARVSPVASSLVERVCAAGDPRGESVQGFAGGCRERLQYRRDRSSSSCLCRAGPARRLPGRGPGSPDPGGQLPASDSRRLELPERPDPCVVRRGDIRADQDRARERHHRRCQPADGTPEPRSSASRSSSETLRPRAARGGRPSSRATASRCAGVAGRRTIVPCRACPSSIRRRARSSTQARSGSPNSRFSRSGSTRPTAAARRAN